MCADPRVLFGECHHGGDFDSRQAHEEKAKEENAANRSERRVTNPSNQKVESAKKHKVKDGVDPCAKDHQGQKYSAVKNVLKLVVAEGPVKKVKREGDVGKGKDPGVPFGNLQRKEAIENKNDPNHIHDELGDVYFTLSQLSRHLGINGEMVAQRGNQKFLDRFAKLEELAVQKSINVREAKSETLESLWIEAKSTENQSS